ncbi:MAG: ADP-ribosylglycohydrolase family protein [Gammaproteobacteria bacterium]
MEQNARIRAAWQGRISGCQLGKAVEALSLHRGWAALERYLRAAGAWPLRGYAPYRDDELVAATGRRSCADQLCRSEADDDINYTVLALLLLEQHGRALTTEDVARAWLRYLPGGATFTAERAAYRILLTRAADGFPFGWPAGFDLGECSNHPWSDWIGAQIRADLYGWACPGRPAFAAELASRDAALSHRGEGVNGARFVAALGAAIPLAPTLDAAVAIAAEHIAPDSAVNAAVAFACAQAGKPDAVSCIRTRYGDLPPAHTVNNLALVVWALLSHRDDFSAAIGEVVAAGWDTDCNGATVGGLWGLQGKPIPAHWLAPWNGRVAVDLAGVGELALEDLVERTMKVAERLGATDQ